MYMDQLLQDLACHAVEYAAGTAGISYCDARAEEYSGASVHIEDGLVDHITEDACSGIGIRMLAGSTWRFASVTNPQSRREIRDALDAATDAIQDTAVLKDRVRLHSVMPERASVEQPVRKRPDVQAITDIGLDCDARISNVREVTKSVVAPHYKSASKFLVSSEGAEIMQTHTDTIIDMTAVACVDGRTRSVDATEGGRGGLEVLTDGEGAATRSSDIAQKAPLVAAAGSVDTVAGTAEVIMNPDFVALLTHEILGHPSEADRVMGREMAWAGGAWWRNMLGKRIGSDALGVADDPTRPRSLGRYDFDDEGTRTRKTILVRDGILEGHMQSRETGELFDAAPTGNMRAAGFEFMPLIRMACTYIEPGDWGTEEMMRDVGDGYLICDMKVPSIDMNRYNWSISCQYAQRIRNGRPAEIIRDVIVSGTAPEFFSSITACGRDLAIRPITNCGKGDPMQSLAMGNGGPSVRATATVSGVV